MSRGLFLIYLLLFNLLQGCGERLNSLRIISSDLFHTNSEFSLNENYRYIKLQVNSNDYSFLALGYNDLDSNGEKISVWYSSDKHVMRTQSGRLHSISSISPLWFGQKYLTKPKNILSHNESFQRIRFGNTPLYSEVHELVTSSNNKIPRSFQKFCDLGEQSLWISEIAVDQFGDKLKSYFGFQESNTNEIHCVYQELDKKNSIQWVYL